MATNTQTPTCPQCGQKVKRAEPNLNCLVPDSRKVYLFIRSYIDAHKISPSMRDIARYMNTWQGRGFSTSMVAVWLNDLEDMGFISRKPKVSRGIVLL